ncbi:hypothetical protein BO71DRAFT_395893 [Aspergillus ellipticus CBS 707.79]|uniref:Uncharacterized protein n=1 Tax=Aspergillus ellipticus CBS 707.79 TaxID=1448320 RepID=A0A319EZU4_9EURO|nr:hypothetical protein BO71DRAFT_395893 [Aspergillus ellipticus CBS 707.79]
MPIWAVSRSLDWIPVSRVLVLVLVVAGCCCCCRIDLLAKAPREGKKSPVDTLDQLDQPPLSVATQAGMTPLRRPVPRCDCHQDKVIQFQRPPSPAIDKRRI